MSMVLVKMTIQNIEFCKFSMSVVVLASYFAAVSMLRGCKQQGGQETSQFCSELRKILIGLMTTDK
jgi:hypothetical protein